MTGIRLGFSNVVCRLQIGKFIYVLYVRLFEVGFAASILNRGDFLCLLI